ncbi:hypothetical protein BDW62DRAFT_37098 [Aspergillus aurantiobrunneus]
MGFKFTFLCDLFSSLEDNRILKAATAARNRNPDVRVVTHWFSRHDKRLRDPDTDQLALLSCMFPEKRTDRVYWLQDTSLARVVGRCLLLGSSRREELEKWRISGGADLGQCVENVMRQAENHITGGQEVTMEEIDTALNLIASRCRFSGPKVRRQRSAVDVEETLSPLYRRLSSRDAKWLTRIILKSHVSNILPEKLTLKSFHFLLPHLLLFQNSFEAAINFLSSEPIIHFPRRPEPGLAKDLGKIALHHLSPEVGVKIGRPEYYKARSIKHCCNMVEQRRMSVERKYDGEYCQIHINTLKHSDIIQIFSKSGKNSTSDRAGVHQAIREALRIGTESCRFKRRCVLEGELLVWSERHQRIMPFHKLRKFISRSGIFIGTESDSPPQPYEHLMMVFFDILVLDDDICLRKPHRERRLLLKDTIQVIPGVSDIAEQRVIDFSRSDGQSKLEALFSMAIAERWEGFVLKGCEDPYFPILIDLRDSCIGRWIKLKKDYIPGLGDTIDLALVGAAYNSRDASSLGLGKELSWTHFFVGCLENRDDVLQFNAEPRLHVIDVIDHHCMSQPNMQMLNRFGKYSARSPDSGHGLYIEYERPGMPRLDVIFKTPFTVEMLGSGFEKPSGARYYTLRFPRILKIHFDRLLEDAVSFQELQILAEAAVSAPPEDILKQEAEWAKRVKSSTSMPGYLPDRSQSLSSETSPTLSKTSAIRRLGAVEGSPTLFSHPAALWRESQESQTKRSFSHNGPSARDIQVYVDRPTSSSSSDRFLEIDGNILGGNGNNSSQGNARKRKASSPSSQVCSKRVRQDPSKENQSMDETRSTLRLGHSTTEGGLASEQLSIHRQAIPNNTTKAEYGSGESPLTTVPVYIHQTTRDKEQLASKGLANIAGTMEDFFLMLTFADRSLNLEKPSPKVASQSFTLGIIFADHSQYPLGPMVLQLNEQISQRLGTLTSKNRPKGRIMLLSSDFLKLDVTWKHDKFCLPKTWERISMHYFCACIAWDFEKCPGVPLDEVPSTPMDNPTHRGSPSDILRRNRNRLPKLRVSFDRKEILLLGELSSRDSLVRVDPPPK